MNRKELTAFMVYAIDHNLLSVPVEQVINMFIVNVPDDMDVDEAIDITLDRAMTNMCVYGVSYGAYEKAIAYYVQNRAIGFFA